MLLPTAGTSYSRRGAVRQWPSQRLRSSAVRRPQSTVIRSQRATYHDPPLVLLRLEALGGSCTDAARSRAGLCLRAAGIDLDALALGHGRAGRASLASAGRDFA